MKRGVDTDKSGGRRGNQRRWRERTDEPLDGSLLPPPAEADGGSGGRGFREPRGDAEPEGRPRSEDSARSEGRAGAEPRRRGRRDRGEGDRAPRARRARGAGGDDDRDVGEPAPRRYPIDPDAPRPTIYPDAIRADRVDPDASKVLRRLNRHGYDAYLVGGGVRDLLLGRSPKDFDVATTARPSELRGLFRNCRIIGRRFRLGHVMFHGGKIIEVATFRRDPGRLPEDGPIYETIEEDGVERLCPRRQPVGDQSDLLIRTDNVFGQPHEDAIRRDFTINGLYYDVEREHVIDYVGGVRDLQNRVVRTIGQPDIRFREDPIRILRAVKFSARLDLGIDPDVYDAMVDLRDELARAAPPRTFEELLRLMRGGAAHRSIFLLWDTGLLGVIVPELAAYLDDDGQEARLTWLRLSALDRKMAELESVPSDAILLSVLFHGASEEFMEGARDLGVAFDTFFEDIATRFSVPRRLRERMRQLVASQRRLRDGKGGNLARRDFFPEAAFVHGIDCQARGDEAPSWAFEPSRFEGGGGARRRKRRPRRD